MPWRHCLCISRQLNRFAGDGQTFYRGRGGAQRVRRTCRILPDIKTAQESDWSAEYLDLILAVKVVEDMDEAITHVATYSSNHTEAIVTRD